MLYCFQNGMLHELARVLPYPRLQALYDLTENLVFDTIARAQSGNMLCGPRS